MNDQIQQLEIQYLKTRIAQLEVERDYLKENVGMLVEETFSLESMLDAIVAGGTPFTPRPSPPKTCVASPPKSASQCCGGYVKQEPARQPLPADTYTALARRIATKYAHRSDPAFCGYAFLPNTLEQFVRAIEQAHDITGGQ